MQNGNFVFPSMEGFVFFKPKEIKSYYPRKEQLFIERAVVEKTPVLFKDTLQVKSGDASVEIYVDLPYFHSTENLYLETKLSGKQTGNWRKLPNDRKYTLPSVRPGIYTLDIRLLTYPDGQFSYKKIHIEIKPLFYQTWWFKISLVILTIGAIMLLIYFRTHYLISINKKTKRQSYP
ncbi:hypothetical protein [Chryseobacterium sp. MMS23-Vi53]|uniref:hypothetical protein n=1 Tax=Chryseobacterium sp. MMS23-Vi53 TaxID=3386644 RepID=UPI0039E82878